MFCSRTSLSCEIGQHVFNLSVLICTLTKFAKDNRLRDLNLALSEQNVAYVCLEEFPCLWRSSARKTCSARRDPELPEQWARQEGREGLSCLSLPRLMMVLPGPGVVTAPPASQLPVLASSVHLETTLSLSQQLHLRNNSNLDNFLQSVIMSFRIVSFSNFTPALSQLFESPWSEEETLSSSSLCCK